MEWGNFTPVDGVDFNERDFCETLDGGQSFTWNKSAESDAPEYVGVFGRFVAKVRLNGDGSVSAAFPKQLDQKAAHDAIEEYLDARTDYGEIRESLKKTGDPIMLAALEIHPTIRILRQNPEEAIVGFICSSSKRIVQIKQCVRLLSERLGEEICPGFHRTPPFEKIADAPIELIRECKLGFRADYLKKTAVKIRADKFDPMLLRSMSHEEAKTYLKTLSGVGDKVADCILLFGASRFEAFPVDTWIKQAMCELYSTENNEKKIREFAAAKFGRHAGFAQQLIFAAKRKGLI